MKKAWIEQNILSKYIKDSKELNTYVSTSKIYYRVKYTSFNVDVESCDLEGHSEILITVNVKCRLDRTIYNLIIAKNDLIFEDPNITEEEKNKKKWEKENYSFNKILVFLGVIFLFAAPAFLFSDNPKIIVCCIVLYHIFQLIVSYILNEIIDMKWELYKLKKGE